LCSVVRLGFPCRGRWGRAHCTAAASRTQQGGEGGCFGAAPGHAHPSMGDGEGVSLMAIKVS
jgi:hypothetical protein